MPNTAGFQVGDRVRCARTLGDSHPVVNMTGMVYRIHPTDIDVLFDGFDSGHDGTADDGSHSHWYVQPEELELLLPRSRYNLPNPIEPESQEPGGIMPHTRDFRAGDRVQCSSLDLVGTVYMQYHLNVDVIFDDFDTGHDGTANDGSHNHMYIRADALELLSPTNPGSESNTEPESECEPRLCFTCYCRMDECCCSYCEHCEQSYEGEFCPNGCDLIRDYSTKVERLYPAIPPFSPDTNGLLRLGVELEVEAKGDTIDGAEAVLARREAKNWIICKSDGSLTDGFEVVTVPSILEEHTKRWPVLLQALRRHTTSWNNKTTGLHVHLSRAFFTQLEIAKFVVFMNAEATRPYVISLAGRSSPKYAALKKKELGDIDVSHSDRYEAVNLQNNKTIEVRIFKGTLNTEHVLADIEFCDALARWVKINTLEQCESWHDFMAYVTEQGNYPNLVDYMTEREAKVQEMLLKQFARHTEKVSVDLTDEGGE